MRGLPDQPGDKEFVERCLLIPVADLVTGILAKSGSIKVPTC